MKRSALSLMLCAFTLLPATAAPAQTGAQTGAQAAAPGLGSPSQHTLIPMANPNIPPELMELVKLETEFERSVAKGGGKAFASWFAEDAVTLNNGQPPVLGHTAIAEHATWDPKDYQLSWYVQGAQMGLSGDTAFTWGHYDATGKDKDGKAFTFSGRYSTFWKKVNGRWKVALDESSSEPPDPDSPNAPPPCTQAQPR